MKTKNITIALLLVCVAVLSILYLNELRKNNPTVGSGNVTPSDIRCVDVVHRITNKPEDCLGNELFGVGKEKNDTPYIRSAIQEMKRTYPERQIYGYQLDLDCLEELMAEIHSIQGSNLKNSDNKFLTIKGVRFYEAVTERIINGRLQRKADLVMIPYLSSGDDIYTVDNKDLPHLANLKMYTHFRPCPKLCSPEKYIFQSGN